MKFVRGLGACVFWGSTAKLGKQAVYILYLLYITILNKMIFLLVFSKVIGQVETLSES